jgi:hypothetical protein
MSEIIHFVRLLEAVLKAVSGSHASYMLYFPQLWLPVEDIKARVTYTYSIVKFGI